MVLVKKGERVSCPECGVFVKSQNLDVHLRNVHKIRAKSRKIPESGERPETNHAAEVKPHGSTVSFPWKWIGAGAVAFVIVVSAIAVAPYVSQILPTNPPNIPAECIQGKTLAIDFTFHLHIIVNDSMKNPPLVEYTRPVWNDLGNTPVNGQPCTRRLSSGSKAEYNATNEPAVIHVRSPEVKNYTLGDFFVVWNNQTLGPGKILEYHTSPYPGPVRGFDIVVRVGSTIYSNQDFDYRTIELAPNRDIEFRITR